MRRAGSARRGTGVICTSLCDVFYTILVIGRLFPCVGCRYDDARDPEAGSRSKRRLPSSRACRTVASGVLKVAEPDNPRSRPTVSWSWTAELDAAASLLAFPAFLQFLFGRLAIQNRLEEQNDEGEQLLEEFLDALQERLL